MGKLRNFILSLFCFALPLFGQYNFSFVCVSDTFQTGTDYFIYYFRLTNTGSMPDSYAFDCRVIDSVPGWFELYCAGGQCAEPGIILYSYLSPGAVDTGITISIYPAPGVWGTEVVKLKVRSVKNPNLKDSINVYAAMEQGIGETVKIVVGGEKMDLITYPNPFKSHLHIRYQISDTRYQIGNIEQGFSLAIYDISGRVVKSFNPASGIKHQESIIVWSGDNDTGKSVPRGVYFIELNNGERKIQRKVVKIK